MHPFHSSLRSGRDLAEDICASLKHNLGVDIMPILLDESMPESRRRARAVRLLLEAAVDRAEESEHRAEWAAPTVTDETPFLTAVAAEAEVDIEPNIAFLQKTYVQLVAMQGADVKDYLYSMTKRFENATNAKTPGQLALELAGGAVLSVGIAWAKLTIQALRAGETVLAAMRTGITSIGMKTAVGVVIVVLVGLLLWLILENPKKCLGMVLNNTDEALVVKDWKDGAAGGGKSNLYMNHGSMVSFMQDYEGGDLSKKIQINPRAYFGPDDPDNSIYGGIYFADKNAGFFGCEGLMVFNSTTSSLQFAHLFAVPYTQDNGTNMKFVSGTADPKALFDELYPGRALRVTPSSGGYSLTSTFNDKRGGIAACIASVSKG